MYRLVIKKTFFNMWDNVSKILLINIVFIAATLCVLFLAAEIIMYNRAVLFVLLASGFWLLNVIIAITSFCMNDIACYRIPALKDLVTYFKIVLLKSLFSTLLIIGFILSILIALRYYFSLKSFMGFVIVSLLFWICLIFVFLIQYYYPVMAQLDKKPVNILTRSFLIFFDNIVFSVFLLLGVMVIFVLSFFTAQLFPGMGTVILWLNVGLKIRLNKYEYFEKYPTADRNKIPWDRLLDDEIKTLSGRTFRNFIFPWKE